MADQTYDYIVVGAGAAGCVLANRLTESGSARVLLLEAGGTDWSPLVKIPAGFSKVMGTNLNWIFDTTPQAALNDRSMFLPQGKVLGGSTSINAMLYVRGNRLDYDEWAALGNDGWGYDDVLPYFIKSENNERLADKYHGTAGPLNVSDQVQHNPLSRAFVRAAQQTGIPFNVDPNGAEQEGVFYHQVTQRKARRESASTAYLKPARKRPGLRVLTGATTTKILTHDGRATGVQYLHRGQLVTALADSEVLVSAGAINTPRLLMLSGIGAAAELEGVGVEVVHDLPGVGKNFHDQLELYITETSSERISYSGQDRWDRAVRHTVQYGAFRTGPATATITEAGAFVKSSDDVRSPDVQLHFLPAYVVWADNARTAARIPGHGFTLLACNIRPQSRGEVRLTSADPNRAPAVNPNYLSEAADWDVAIKSFHILRDILAAPALQQFTAQEHMPGREVQTDAEIREYIKKWAKTDYHPVGSCKMGTDELAVVDPQLRVHGMEGLRVIDSSIMPNIISGNTQAPSMMIGEKGAAMILADSSV